MLTHTREKPHQCKVCDKKFLHSSNLTRHIKQIHEKKGKSKRKKVKKERKESSQEKGKDKENSDQGLDKSDDSIETEKETNEDDDIVDKLTKDKTNKSDDHADNLTNDKDTNKSNSKDGDESVEREYVDDREFAHHLVGEDNEDKTEFSDRVEEPREEFGKHSLKDIDDPPSW